MIDRYSTPEMREVWSSRRRFERMLEVEVAYLEALEEDGIAPPGGAAVIRERVRLDPARIEALEETLRHDVIAFLAHVEEQVGEAGRFLHFGLTSSDALDTALALQFQEAGALILRDWGELDRVLLDQAQAHRGIPVAGRTHGMHAEVTSFGLVLLGWREMVARSLERLRAGFEEVRVGKLSGAVGNLAFGDPEREARVLSRLGLRPEPCATQVVARDRHAALFSALAQGAAVIEAIATNLRHLQRTEVGEAEEPFGRGQRGSSAMPHKKNPILGENLCGLARLVRSYSLAALEDVALWHERDISHSSVERVIAPDATSLIHFSVRRLAGILRGLQVRPDRMARNLAITGDVLHSEAVLLALVRAGLRRQEAYGLVQRNALKALSEGGSFQERLRADPEVAARIPEDDLAACFSLDRHLRFEPAIFHRRSPDPPEAE